MINRLERGTRIIQEPKPVSPESALEELPTLMSGDHTLIIISSNQIMLYEEAPLPTTFFADKIFEPYKYHVRTLKSNKDREIPTTVDGIDYFVSSDVRNITPDSPIFNFLIQTCINMGLIQDITQIETIKNMLLKSKGMKKEDALDKLGLKHLVQDINEYYQKDRTRRKAQGMLD